MTTEEQTIADINAELAGALIGVAATIDGATDDLAAIVTDRGAIVFVHYTDCCEGVYLADGADELRDLVGHRFVSLEEVSSEDAPPPAHASKDDSYTWTFYKVETDKGTATLRFLGESNGYYSEEVNVKFRRVWTS